MPHSCGAVSRPLFQRCSLDASRTCLRRELIRPWAVLLVLHGESSKRLATPRNTKKQETPVLLVYLPALVHIGGLHLCKSGCCDAFYCAGKSVFCTQGVYTASLPPHCERGGCQQPRASMSSTGFLAASYQELSTPDDFPQTNAFPGPRSLRWRNHLSQVTRVQTECSWTPS